MNVFGKWLFLINQIGSIMQITALTVKTTLFLPGCFTMGDADESHNYPREKTSKCTCLPVP